MKERLLFHSNFTSLLPAQNNPLKPRRIVGTRLHGIDAANSLNSDWMRKWCDCVLEYADAILIAADCACCSPLRERLHGHQPRVTVLLVDPWLSVTHPLNTLVEKALFDGAAELILQSSEVWIDKRCIEAMSRHLEEDTLVVGAGFSERHADFAGTVPLDGLASPWNTLALWDLKKLARTGFLPVSGGLLAGIPGGMEEVAAISLLQHMDPVSCRAKVFKASRRHWAIHALTPERAALHEIKMQTKYQRAERQLQHLGIPRGSVILLEGGETSLSKSETK
uniref:Uncharacterized protein n=1 Tax=Candidatus Kentrum sp. MB TaxID=2138164 RepID=A0A450Y3D9_9GAMM|nr:MAG: hypothetical protein BECKMB1821I_GA0114274_11693 [Candidatus Kentron sp. MB]